MRGISSPTGQGSSSWLGFLGIGSSGRGCRFTAIQPLAGKRGCAAFGLSRFIDDNAFLVNFEERIPVFERRIFDHPISIEAAPFLDVGRVFENFSLKDMQVNPGAGLRLLARPNIVGRLDIGYGRDG